MNEAVRSLLSLVPSPLARFLVSLRKLGEILGVAAFGPPVRWGSGWEAELLVVADPLPPRRARVPWLQAAPVLRVRLLWRGLAALDYPSPRYLEILQKGAVLYDPQSLLAAAFNRIRAELPARGLDGAVDGLFPCWHGAGNGSPGALIPSRLPPAAVGREGRALGP